MLELAEDVETEDVVRELAEGVEIEVVVVLDGITFEVIVLLLVYVDIEGYNVSASSLNNAVYIQAKMSLQVSSLQEHTTRSILRGHWLSLRFSG